MNNNLIITIGRQNGSGGRYIGEKLAAALGIKCYNGELITETAKSSGMHPDYIQQHDEKQPQNLMYFGGQAIPLPIFLAQSKAIREIAERESCVFIGRCSNYVLREHPNTVNIFVHAPLGARIARICRRDNLDTVSAERCITHMDNERAGYYNFYTKQKWGAACNYHLCLDTSLIGIDSSVEMIKMYTALRNGGGSVL